MDKKSNKDFNLADFNAEFDSYISKNEEDKSIEKTKVLNELNKVTNTTTPLLKYSIGETLIGIKDTYLRLMNEVLTFQFGLDSITRENGLYFIGLSILIICLLSFVANSFTITSNKSLTDNK